MIVLAEQCEFRGSSVSGALSVSSVGWSSVSGAVSVGWMEQCELLPSEVSRGCSSRSGLCIRCRLNAHDKGRLEERGVVARHGNSIRHRGA